MADINVERRGPRVWPWIIGIVILVLLIWAIAEIVDREETPNRETIEVVPAPVGPGQPVRPPGAPEPIPGPGGATPGATPAPGPGGAPGATPPAGSGGTPGATTPPNSGNTPGTAPPPNPGS